MNHSIRAKLDRVMKLLSLCSVTNPITHVEQVSYLIFLKILDEKEDECASGASLDLGCNGRIFAEQAERYRWQSWCLKSGQELRDFLRDEVFPYMGSLAKDTPQVAEYFRDAVLEIVEPDVLEQLVKIIDSITFNQLSSGVKGDVYEHLLSSLDRNHFKTLGMFRTPRQIRAFMVEMLDPDVGDTIFDPACGTGGFLVDSLTYLLSKHSKEPIERSIYGEEWLEEQGLSIAETKEKNPNLQTYRTGLGEDIPDCKRLGRSIYGLDLSRQMMRISTMNMLLHGVENCQIKRANALSHVGGLTEDDLNRRYTMILGTPPFGGTLPRESIRADLPTKSRKSELLFLALMMESLAAGGRCAVLVPESVMFASTRAHVELRRKLCSDFEIQAVISLPNGAFKPYAGIKTSVLVFRRPMNPPVKGQSATNKVWFYDIAHDGFSLDKIRGGVRPRTPEENDIPKMLEAWRRYRASGFEVAPGEVANANLAAGSDEPACWWATLETIAGDGYNLDAGRYRPLVAQEVPDEDPVALIEEILGLERELVIGLEKLLVDVRSVG